MGSGTRSDTSESIFDMAARRGKLRRRSSSPEEKKKGEKASFEETEELLPPLLAQQDEEVMEHWKRCKEMYRTLEQKLDALFQNSSITPQALHRFLSDPKNFSREQWIAIEEAKEKNKERFLELSQQLSSEGKEAVQSYLVASRQKEEPSQVRKEGQKKTSGSKKKILPRHKWLEMH